MILCPNCKHQEIDGALFCSECGAQIVFSSDSTGNEMNEIKSEPQGQKSTPSIPEEKIVKPGFTLKLLSNGQLIQLSGQNEFTIGRITEGQPILPDIDLSPYEGYAEGVSRLHAAIRKTEKGYLIVDLGSSNGTRINGQKIVSNVSYPLKDGDVLALGRIKLQVLIR
jgi:pSer/pThr/pTyr-binding forkhead associated (FHA) protein